MALMMALRAHLCARAKDLGTYGGYETLYEGQHSRFLTTAAYLKGVELSAPGHEMSIDVFGRDFLAMRAASMVRFSLTLRSPALRHKGLQNAGDWTDEIARELMLKHIEGMTPLHGTVIDLKGLSNLKGLVAARLKLWLMGDLTAFEQSADMKRKQRATIKAVTGIDINSPFSVQRQKEAIVSVQAILAEGFGFRSREDKWASLQEGRKLV